MPADAEVTIAVPVHNGAAYLGECLDCLRTQSFEDIAVLVLDNASDDATPDIAADFAARDSRFSLLRHDENIGALANFRHGLALARSPFFMWRADDDLSDANYVETLRGLLTAEPRAALAVGNVRSVNMDGSNERMFPFPTDAGPLSLMFRSRASWFYGLWRREELESRYDEVVARFPFPWGHDHLTLLPFLLDGAVAGTAETNFVQRFKKTAGQTRRADPSVGEMWRVRRHFAAECRRAVAESRSLGMLGKLQIAAMLPSYIGKRTYRLPKIAGALLARR